MTIEYFKTFFKENKWVVIFGIATYALFLYLSISGNRFCDCISTEKSKPAAGSRVYMNRFYHK